MAFAISAAGDKFGFATFSDNVTNKFPPSRGIGHFYKLTKTLTDPYIYGGGFDFNKVMDFLLYYLHRRGTLIFIVSDFIGMKREWFKKLKLLASRMETIAIIVRDPRDEVLLPVGLALVEDPFSKKKILIDTGMIKDKYAEYVQREEDILMSRFQEFKIDHIMLSTAEDFVNPLMAFFTKRRQRWR